MMTLRYEDEAGGAFDPDDFGRLVPVSDDPDYDYGDLLDEWEAPQSVEETSRTIAAVAEQRDEVRDRIDDRRRYGATEESLAADLRLLDALDDQLVEAHHERRLAEAAQRERHDLKPSQRTKTKPSDPWREALVAELSPEDLALYDARRAGVSQKRLARDLGISQGAVSKREARIVSKVQELHVAINGRPLESLGGKRRPRVRGKGRNIPGSG